MGIKGNITFRQAVTGLIEPTPDMCQPLLFVITRFPQQALLYIKIDEI